MGGIIPLRLVVKRIKNNLYVYLEGRENGKHKTLYIGSLDTITRYYIAFFKPELRERLRGEWWTGRDLNPGPLGCKPSALPG